MQTLVFEVQPLHPFHIDEQFLILILQQHPKRGEEINVLFIMINR